MAIEFRIHHYPSLGSTSDEVCRLADDGAPHGTVVQADQQTSGRGRLSRTWFSPPGNLYLSVLLRLQESPARIPELGFVAALAVADTVEALLPSPACAFLKWPNDVQIKGAKIAGILLEQVNDATIMGIGLNVLFAPSNSAYETTTIAANGGVASVNGARDILLTRLTVHLTGWQVSGFAPVRKEWTSRSHAIGDVITVKTLGRHITGQFAGLDIDGALLLDTPSGREKIMTADLSGPGPSFPKDPD